MQNIHTKKHKKLLNNTSTSARAIAAKKDNMNRTYSLLELAQPVGDMQKNSMLAMTGMADSNGGARLSLPFRTDEKNSR